VSGPKVIDAGARQRMREILQRIQTGEYAKDFVLESRAGAPTLLSRRRMTAELPIEKVGGKLRDMMPWIRKNRLVDTSKN
jgi:ketol-acid reductoisomerase